MSNSLSNWSPQGATPARVASLPAAGWFTDPASATKLRWWDGSAWSDHTMDAPDVSLADPIPQTWSPPPTAAEEPLRRERSRGRDRDAGPRRSGRAEVAQAVVPTVVQMTPLSEAPYVPYSQQFSPMRSITPMRVMGSPNTRPVWALALLPWLIQAGVAALLVTGAIYQAYYSLLAVGGLALVVLLLVLADRAALKARNIRPASGWWLLLSAPLAYFIARWAVLGSQGVKSAAPGIVYVFSCLLSNAALVFVLPLITGLTLPEIVALIQPHS